MDDQDGTTPLRQLPPEMLQRLLQQAQPQEQQRNLTIGGLSLLLPTLSDLEFASLQGDLQATVNYWLRAKGLLV